MEKTEELPIRNFQFSLRALFIWVTVAAMLIWLFRDHPVVCVGIAVLSIDGIVRTCIDALQKGIIRSLWKATGPGNLPPAL